MLFTIYRANYPSRSLWVRYLMEANMPYIEELNINVCDHCAQECKKQCSACKYAKYCSSTCAAADWKNHSGECPALAIFAAEREKWRIWITENRIFLRTMIKPGTVIQLTRGDEIQCDTFTILEFIAKLDKKKLDDLLKFVDAEEKRCGRGSINKKESSDKLQSRQYARPDTPSILLAVDGALTVPADLSTLNKFTLFECQYSSGPKWELIHRI